MLIVLSFNAASPMMVDSSLQSGSEPEDAVETDPSALVVSEYIEEIHNCLREAEVRL